MQIINRTMKSGQINTEDYFECQASINSDGRRKSTKRR